MSILRTTQLLGYQSFLATLGSNFLVFTIYYRYAHGVTDTERILYRVPCIRFVKGFNLSGDRDFVSISIHVAIIAQHDSKCKRPKQDSNLHPSVTPIVVARLEGESAIGADTGTIYSSYRRLACKLPYGVLDQFGSVLGILAHLL